nr:MAG TPA: hypothetical protein [Caudoviricetes sp.]
MNTLHIYSYRLRSFAASVAYISNSVFTMLTGYITP